jgi:hypothetical protein
MSEQGLILAMRLEMMWYSSFTSQTQDAYDGFVQLRETGQ